MKKTGMLLVIMLLIVCFVACGCACSSSNEKEKVGLVTWEENPDTEMILETCGLDPDSYDVVYNSIPGADKERNSDGTIDSSGEDAQIEANVCKMASDYKMSCTVIVFQIGSRYSTGIDEFLSENEGRTVFVLSTDGTEILDSQN